MSAITVPQLFLVRNSAIVLVVRNIAELRRCGLTLRMPSFGDYISPPPPSIYSCRVGLGSLAGWDLRPCKHVGRGRGQGTALTNDKPLSYVLSSIFLRLCNLAYLVLICLAPCLPFPSTLCPISTPKVLHRKSFAPFRSRSVLFLQ
jgi:hypothetical protein